MSEEHKQFEELFNAMKTEHSRVAPSPTAEYDTLIAGQQRLLDKHSKMVSDNVAFLTEHGDIIKQHADNKISDKDVQDKRIKSYKQNIHNINDKRNKTYFLHYGSHPFANTEIKNKIKITNI